MPTSRARRRQRQALLLERARRRTAEAALHDSELRFRSLMDNLRNIIVCRGAKGKIRHGYDTDSAAIYGRDAQAIAGTVADGKADIDLWYRSIHLDDLPAYLEAERRRKECGEDYTIEYRFTHPQTGVAKWAHECGWTTRNSGDGQVYFDSYILDISAQKQLEQELIQHRSTLEELVAERTAALLAAQDELLRHERLAVLGQLTATVSHELRNPLGTIRNSLYALHSYLPNPLPPVQQVLARIERNILRCVTIIEELLAFSRHREPVFAPVALDDWLSKLVAELELPAGITLTTALAAATTVPLDEHRLRQAVVNVVQNAVEAMGEDNPMQAIGNLHIASTVAEERLLIHIRDNGPGIPVELQQAIFKPLFTTKAFGCGLGLPLVQQIMEQHGGGILIDSAPGTGATITLWLPTVLRARPD